jgi:SRSO17 transposase
MTADDVRAAGLELYDLHKRFAPLFGTRPAQANALTYLRGLLLHEGRKNTEAIALHFGDGKVDTLQKFLALSPWNHLDVMREIQSSFATTLVPTTTQWNLGTVGVIDESSFPKKGDLSVGVARQWCGRLGKKENCQVGVFIVGVTPGGTALLDQQIYLSEDWILDRERRANAGVPHSVFFQTKQEIALRQHARIEENRHVQFDWLTFDEAYGRDGAFLGQLERRGQKYVGEVPVSTTVWTKDPATQIPEYSGRGRQPTKPKRDSVQSVKEVAESLAKDKWKTLCLREGSCAPVVFQFAAVRVWSMRDSEAGPPAWLLIRRPLDGSDDVKYYTSNAEEETPIETMASVSGCRVKVEECFQDGKTHLGMSHYEGRSWTGWHHHMALVSLALLFVIQVRLRLAPKTTGLNMPNAPKSTPLSVDMALRLLKAALPKPDLSLEATICLVEYYQNRNEVAKRSHRKMWEKRHLGVKIKPLIQAFDPQYLC